MFARCLLTWAVLIVVGAPLSADELHLKDGRRLLGKVVRRENGELHFRMPMGTVVFAETLVLRVVEGPSPEEIYKQRLAAITETTPVDEANRLRLDLARWCDRHGMRREERQQLEEIVLQDPEHREARHLLGHQRIDGQWMTRAEARDALDLVRHDGRWRPRAEVEAEKKDRTRKQHVAATQRRANQLMRRMAYSSSVRTRSEAHASLIALAKREELPLLGAMANSLHRQYEQAWEHVGTATVEVRAQQATLTNLRQRSVSLGTGSPVTIELPEVRHVGIGTTVIAPIGR